MFDVSKTFLLMFDVSSICFILALLAPDLRENLEQTNQHYKCVDATLYFWDHLHSFGRAFN
jgi:hypothetical protein